MLTTEQFDRTRVLALRLAGIELQERHRELLCHRYRRIETRGPASFDALLSAAEEGDPAAGRQLVGLITTNFTGFFRHPWHFEVAAEHALVTVRRRGRARFWSAGAATGEEPYSVAIALLEAFQCEDPPVTILATDVSEDGLRTARQGDYGEPALAALESARRMRFFSELVGPGRWRIAPALRRLVEFRPLNMADGIWPVEGPFEVIFCRNVVMYLEAHHRHVVLERLASLLRPDGLLLLDPTEHLGKAGHLFTPHTNGVYSLRATLRIQL